MVLIILTDQPKLHPSPQLMIEPDRPAGFQTINKPWYRGEKENAVLIIDVLYITA